MFNADMRLRALSELLWSLHPYWFKTYEMFAMPLRYDPNGFVFTKDNLPLVSTEVNSRYFYSSEHMP